MNHHSPARFRTPSRIGKPRVAMSALRTLQLDMQADLEHPWRFGLAHKPSPGYYKPYLGDGYWLVWRKPGVLLAAFYGQCWCREAGRYVTEHWLEAFVPTTCEAGGAIFTYADQAWRLMRSDEPGYPPQMQRAHRYHRRKRCVAA